MISVVSPTVCRFAVSETNPPAVCLPGTGTRNRRSGSGERLVDSLAQLSQARLAAGALDVRKACLDAPGGFGLLSVDLLGQLALAPANALVQLVQGASTL